MLVQATAEYVLAGNIMYINIVSDVSATAEYVLTGNIMYINIVSDVSAGYGGVCVDWKYNVYKHTPTSLTMFIYIIFPANTYSAVACTNMV